MYVITDHNSGDFVILGPIAWNPRYISSILSDELDEDISVSKEDEARVPFVVHPGVIVRRCESVYEDINPKTQRHEGPVWAYDTKHPSIQATATWCAADKDIDTVRSELKAQVADIRWSKEHAEAMVLRAKPKLQGEELIKATGLLMRMHNLVVKHKLTACVRTIYDRPAFQSSKSNGKFLLSSTCL